MEITQIIGLEVHGGPTVEFALTATTVVLGGWTVVRAVQFVIATQ